MFHRFLSPSFSLTAALPQNYSQIRNQALCLLVIICFFVNQAFSQSEQVDEILDLGAFVNEYELDIHFWEVTIKETVRSNQAEEMIQELKKTYEVEEERNDQRTKYTVQTSLKEGHFNVIYHVLIPQDSSNSAELIAVLHGEEWNQKVQNSYIKEKEIITKKFFSKMMQVYTCLSVQDSGIMNLDIFINTVKNYFNIKHISSQYDNVQNSRIKNSTYGYIKAWKNYYFMENDPINVQIAAVADRQGEIHYTIGTPILINEY